MPASVALALTAELAALPDASRLVLEAAAVVGDPFEPALAAEAADVSEPDALRALDELLTRALVRPAGAARRFAFRHPVVRHAVYEGAPGGWRLAAHARAAAALERRGAGLVARAHHVEHAAQLGDEAAIDLLEGAARELQGPAPASSARFHAAALRILPDSAATRERRAAIQVALAEAQSAAGDRASARETLLATLADTHDPQERHALTVRIANVEMWLGGEEQARRRLYVALGDVPAEPSADRIRLHLSLGLLEHFGCDFAGRPRAGERRAGRRRRRRRSGARRGGADAARDRRRRGRRRRRRAGARRGRRRVRAAHRRPGRRRGSRACGCSPGPTARAGASATRSRRWSGPARWPRRPGASRCSCSRRSRPCARCASWAGWTRPSRRARRASTARGWTATRSS